MTNVCIIRGTPCVQGFCDLWSPGEHSCKIAVMVEGWIEMARRECESN